jgi:hypothetical protein
MTRTRTCAFATLAVLSCLSIGLLIASAARAQGAAANASRDSGAIDLNELIRHWVHSGEEEQSGDLVQVFRPAASMAFPPSRFRMAYKFSPGGDCALYVLSPDDNHRFEPCRWNIRANGNMILRIVENGTTISFRIVELSAKVLRLRPLQ